MGTREILVGSCAQLVSDPRFDVCHWYPDVAAGLSTGQESIRIGRTNPVDVRVADALQRELHADQMVLRPLAPTRVFGVTLIAHQYSLGRDYGMCHFDPETDMEATCFPSFAGNSTGMSIGLSRMAAVDLPSVSDAIKLRNNPKLSPNGNRRVFDRRLSAAGAQMFILSEVADTMHGSLMHGGVASWVRDAASGLSTTDGDAGDSDKLDAGDSDKLDVGDRVEVQAKNLSQAELARR